MAELIGVGPTSVELFVSGTVRVTNGLLTDTPYEQDGVAFRTLPSIGATRSTVATVNDVHFGETECGKIEGVTAAAFVSSRGEPPYPEVMNAAIVADISARGIDAVIVKGDLTSEGTWEEYATFQRFYEPAFGERLTHVRGNHDSFHGEVFAAWPLQVVDVPGLRVILLDTSRTALASGDLDASQISATREAAEATDNTVIVMGHHPLFVPDVDVERHYDGVARPASDALLAALLNLPQVVAYTAGHTHRCRRHDVEGLELVEVACVKDFPGAWAEYQVGDQGIAQIVHRATSPAAVAWAEKTRTMFDGYYGTYAMGTLNDRCFTMPLRRTSVRDVR